MNELEYLQKIVDEKTPGPWWSGNLTVYLGTINEVHEILYEAENGPNAKETNNDFIATFGTLAPLIMEVLKEADEIDSRDLSIYGLQESLSDLKTAVRGMQNE